MKVFELVQNGENAELKAEVMEAIEKDGMGPYYTHVCELLGWKEDSSKRAELDAQVEAKLAEIDGQIAEAEKSEGDVEVRDHMVSRALALAASGDVERTLEAIDVVLEKTVGAGPKLDLAFLKIRMGLFYLDHERLSVFLADADELAEAGGDWERRNRLKAYTAVYSMSIRKFDRAAELFLGMFLFCLFLFLFLFFLSLFPFSPWGLISSSNDDTRLSDLLLNRQCHVSEDNSSFLLTNV